jgi:hypothetical protein
MAGVVVEVSELSGEDETGEDQEDEFFDRARERGCFHKTSSRYLVEIDVIQGFE